MNQSEKKIPHDGEIEVLGQKTSLEKWTPIEEDYTPGFSEEQWLGLLNNANIIGPLWGGVLAAFYEFGGAATCLQIAKRYHKSPSSISGMCTQLAKRINKETHCPLLLGTNGKYKYWPILFQGKKAGPDVEGRFIWKIRPELYEALTKFDILRYCWEIEAEYKDINTPLEPAEIIHSNNIVRYICGKCGYDFRKADRCPECGQLVKTDI